MTKIKLCGLSRICDIEAVNLLKPEYVGFVFAPKSKRYVSMETAEILRENLNQNITTVGVFVNEQPETIADLVRREIIGIAQLHGTEDEAYIQTLRSLIDCPIIKAVSVTGKADLETAESCSAEYVLLDSGKGGTGETFDWSLLSSMKRPYFLAGGLHPGNVAEAVRTLRPFAVDVSSGIETEGLKDRNKMQAFVDAVRQ